MTATETALLIDTPSRDEASVLFPGALLPPKTEAASHRQLTLPGTDFHGAWTNDRRYFDRNTQTGVLRCDHVWWLELGGAIPCVPAGRWEVELLLMSGSRRVSKHIDWFVHVDDDTTPPALAGLPVLHHTTGQRPLIFGMVNQWTRFRLGVITVRTQPNRVRIHVKGITGSMLSDLSFGGLALRPFSVGWKKEALLLRWLKGAEELSVVGGNERRATRGKTHELTSSKWRRRLVERVVPAALLPSQDRGPAAHAPSCVQSNASNTPVVLCGGLPQDVVFRIAQYLITPLPTETLLQKNY